LGGLILDEFRVVAVGFGLVNASTSLDSGLSASVAMQSYLGQRVSIVLALRLRTAQPG